MSDPSNQPFRRRLLADGRRPDLATQTFLDHIREPGRWTLAAEQEDLP